MRATLEIELPKNCSVCVLSYQKEWIDDYVIKCGILKKTVQSPREVIDHRDPKCPLKIAPSCAEADKLDDGKCAGYQKSDIDDEPAEMCMECKQNIFYEEAWYETRNNA